MSGKTTTAVVHHERRTRRLRRLLEQLDACNARLGTVRVIGFLSAVGLGAATFPWPGASTALSVLALLSFAAFVAAAVLHRGPRRRALLAREVVAASERELLRAEGRWSELERDGSGLAPDCPFAADLALVGRWSLFQAISRCSTPFGERALASHLGRGVAAPDLGKRQGAVRELAVVEGFRQRLEAGGARGRLEGSDPDVLVRLLTRPSIHDDRRWLEPAAQALVALTLVQGVLSFAFGLPTAFWAFVLAQVVIFWLTAPRCQEEFVDLLEHETSAQAWAGMLALVERRRFRSPVLQGLRAALRGERDEPASRALSRLSGILGALEVRGSLMHPVLNVLFLWDLLHSARLARWRRRVGANVRTWFVALGELEALSSLGATAASFEAPCFAELADGGPAWSGESVTHPLLPRATAVANDVDIDGSGSLVLLTGSNMSGKSTLLRSIGLNTVLALAGGPVFATRLRMRPCRLMTSIHVTDALDAGVSLFYAEVKRLKTLLDAVALADADESLPPVLYLIDEMLRGTNTRERLIAGRAVIRRLSSARSFGVVTSHEISLAALADELESMRNFHFQESLESGRMTFDYTLRDGPVHSSNALEILRLEGIDLGLEAQDG